MAPGLFFASAVVWLAAVLAIVLGGILLANHRRGAGWAILVVGVAVTVSPFAIAAWAASPLSNPMTIHVEGFRPATDPGLTVDLRHTRDFDSGTEYHFGNAGDAQRVVAVFQEQHPDGVVTLADGASPRVGESIWHLSTDEVRYDLTYASEGNWFVLATQVVALHPKVGGGDLRIPFPRSALGAEEVNEGQPYVNGWSMKEWRNFYAGISSANLGHDWIGVRSTDGDGVVISVVDGITTVTTVDDMELYD